MTTRIDFGQCMKNWEKFYQEAFGRKYDFSGIAIPRAPDDFQWLICMAGDISIKDWILAGKDRVVRGVTMFNLPKLENPDDNYVIPSFGREGIIDQYIILVKADPAGDIDLRKCEDVNPLDLWGDKNTIGLREWLAVCRFFYHREKIILGQEVATICFNSSFTFPFDGMGIPEVYGNKHGVFLGIYYPGAPGRLRYREAIVSL